MKRNHDYFILWGKAIRIYPKYRFFSHLRTGSPRRRSDSIFLDPLTWFPSNHEKKNHKRQYINVCGSILVYYPADHPIWELQCQLLSYQRLRGYSPKVSVTTFQ